MSIWLRRLARLTGCTLTLLSLFIFAPAALAATCYVSPSGSDSNAGTIGSPFNTLQTGQSRWFVGYKKPTLRLWLPTTQPSVTLLPLVSWVTPANVAEGGLLVPMTYCRFV